MTGQSLKITILGCGNSAGTPAIGNYWGQCDPDEPRNRRLRPSIAVQSETTTLVVDTGPDFREQVNRAGIPYPDAVLYTHAHSDHVAGIDDLRIVRHRTKKLVDIYGNAETISDLQNRFDYLFVDASSIYPQVLDGHVIPPGQYGRPFTIGDIGIVPFAQEHGSCTTLGFRFGDLAYCTDVVALDADARAALAGIRTWIVDGAGYKLEHNLVHFTLRQIYEINEHIGAENVFLTHLTPGMDYGTLRKELPRGYAPAYDGLTLTAVCA